MFKAPADIWWGEIGGSVRFLQSISDGFSDGKSVLIVIPQDMPWRDYMRDNFNLPSGAVRFDVDVAERWSGSTKIAENLSDYIIENNTPRKGYRGDFFAYYASNCSNRNSVYWFKGIPEALCKSCIAFLIEYAERSAGRNLPPIVMEVRCEFKEVKCQKVCVVNWQKYVTSFDSMLFAYWLVPQELLPLQKKYLAEVCSSLFEWDAEICAYAIKKYSRQILQCKWDVLFAELSNGFPRRGQDINHFLSLYRNDRMELLLTRIWQAQIRTFFPVIEEKRLNYVKKYYNYFIGVLNDRRFNIVDCLTGKKISDPYDLEIGQIVFCTVKVNGSIDGKDKIILDSLHDARNDLAHLNVLTAEKIDKLFKI